MGSGGGGKGGGSKPPPAPDPYQVAAAQTGAYLTSAEAQQRLNAVNQQTPYGSSNFYKDPVTGQLVQQTSLNPANQFQLGAQQLGNAYLSGIGLSDLGNVANSFGNLDFNGLPAQVSGVAGGPVQGGVQNNGSQYQTQLAPSHLSIQQIAQGDIPTISGGSAYNFNTSNLPNLKQDYGKQFDEVSRSVLNARLPVLNQLQDQQNRELTDRLAGQGITQGTPAFDREMQLLSQNQGQNYNSLSSDAFGQGLQTQGQLFNQQLGSRQQLFGEQATQAANALAAQQLNEEASSANAQNALAKFGINNAAQAQQFGENLSAGQFKNAALGQQFGQNLAAGEFGNTAQQQSFGQGLQNAGLQNAARQTGIQEQLLQHQFPLQQYGALQGLIGNVGPPQFSGYPTSTVGSPNLGQYFQNAFEGQQNAYNQQVASQNSKNSGLLSAGSTLGAAYLASDRRLKEGIVKVGRLDNGLPVYVYRYKGENVQRLGLMADDVEKLRPEAVITGADGFKRVDYGAASG